MKKSIRYDILFDSVKTDAYKQVIKANRLRQWGEAAVVAVKLLTVVFSVLIFCGVNLSLYLYYFPFGVLLAYDVFSIVFCRILLKNARRLCDEKKSDKNYPEVYAALVNYCHRSSVVIDSRIIIYLFFVVVTSVATVYSDHTIGADITLFLKNFVAVINFAIVALDTVFALRLWFMATDFADEYSQEIDKIYYEQSQSTQMPTLETKKPHRFLLFLGCVFYGKPFFKLFFKGKADKTALKELKPPYLVINNHGSAADFRVVTPVFYPKLSNYIVAYGQFVGHPKLFRNMGIIPKRQFDNSIGAIREAQKVFKRKGVLTFYPEGKVSSDGRAGIVRPAMAKFIKLCKVPVVFMLTEGAYIARPKWANKLRRFPVSVKYDLILTADDVAKMTPKQIDDVLQKNFARVDDFEYQRKNGFKLKNKDRAEGLHNILYACPNCGTQFKTASKGSEIFCEECGKRWQLDEYNRLRAVDGKTEYTKICDWYDWQRKVTEKEIVSQKYAFSSRCKLQYLADFDGWRDLGEGSVLQTQNGFDFVSDDGSIFAFDTTAVFSLPYDYTNGLQVTDDRFCYRIILPQPQVATKVNFAVEIYFDLKHGAENHD